MEARNERFKLEFIDELKQIMEKYNVGHHITIGTYEDYDETWFTFNGEVDFSNTVEKSIIKSSFEK